ncbi:C-terminal binding protein [Propionispora vibrioides]|uniref:D-3-phosphoglycerate dehydrogenase n=1 Tax=Propionispora vibrioides TaxID=112903 RepID=A0A1H8XFV5_9FIRM|nr:C-terminal binding protein [Propionispora vibrioides]SEP38739.1 D-3-phosphoglycerate dehydrogenase [Propionispora vibrioides]
MSSNPLIWIIDEEWPDYEIEKEILNKAYANCTIKYSTYDIAADLTEFGDQVDAVICQVYAYITAAMLEKMPKCKAIAVYGGGFDRVDIQAAKARGIKVTNVSNYCAEDLADYVLAAIYHFNKRLTTYADSMAQGLWGAQAVAKPVRRIKGSQLLIVGFGRIGRVVAARAKAVHMEVLAHDAYVSRETMAACGVEKVELAAGLAQADFVSVNAIYIPETEGLLAYREFKLMKPTAYLINTARGRILVEDDLIKAVQDGSIAGAAVDVIANEPPKGDEAILHCDKILVTPHISYISIDSYTELKTRVVGNIITMLKGEIPADLVNP